MLKKRIINIGGCILLGILIVFVLYRITEHKRHSPNGFIRLANPHKIKGLGFKDVKYKTWNITGMYGDRVYLGNNLTPEHLMVLDTGLKDTLLQKLTWPDGLKVRKGATVGIAAGRIYLEDGLLPAVSSGPIYELKLDRVQQTPFFTACVPLLSGNFVFRSVHNGSGNILIKQTGKKLDYNTGLLEKQVDGLFCTDGLLVDVPQTGKLIYVYYYRNQFLVMDTCLKRLYKGKTIDTTSKAKIKVAQFNAST